MSFPDSIVLSYEQAFSKSATKQASLGTRGTLPDGRVFRYAKNGATALIAGTPVIGAAPGQYSMLHTSMNGQFPTGTTFDTAASVLRFGGSWDGTSNGITANDYADGWLLVGSTVTALNTIQMLRIKSHTAQSGGTSQTGDSVCVVTLEDGEHPKWDITSSAGVAFVANPYNGTVVATSTAAPTNDVLGVPVIAVNASYYYWLQTWGDCAVRVVEAASSALALGGRVIHPITAATTGVALYNSSNNAGRGQNTIGVLRSLAGANSFAVVGLTLSP
jgi:hypothetical protein